MPTVNPMPLRDPLQIFLENRGATHPIPLVSTDFTVTIDGGLAIVTTTRLFRNVETGPIEATLTFPMPVHATLFDLEVKIAGRTLNAKAQVRKAARATYEDAIDRGKSAVLHEEVLRGIHMLSVANIPAGETIEVTTQWVTTLTLVSSGGHLRIPVTVGQIYGRSPLPESDDLKTGGEALFGSLTVNAPGAHVRLVGGDLEDGKARLLLNRPIDLAIDQWRQGPVDGVAASGLTVSLKLEPQGGQAAPLNIALLVDHSGSMGEAASSGTHPLSRHSHVIAALKHLKLAPGDAVDLWEFANAVRRIGSSRETGLDQLVGRLSGPSGGTEIGEALSRSIRESTTNGILLITDGKSHALDVQGLAKLGRRITVVLVGEDSLEANVGHLAALTGGDIFVSGGADIAELLTAALASLRQYSLSGERTFQRAGMAVSVTYGAASATAERTREARAVAAAAASFLLPTLEETKAARLAEREGIVSHLTSLVLVDEAGVTQEALPGQRPVPLPSPAVAASPMTFEASARRRSGRGSAIMTDEDTIRRRSAFKAGFNEVKRLFTPRPRAADLAGKIDWATHPDQLTTGDLSSLPEPVHKAVLAIAEKDDVKRAAMKLGLSPVLLIIALLAYRSGDRAAARITRKLLGQIKIEELQKLTSLLDA